LRARAEPWWTRSHLSSSIGGDLSGLLSAVLLKDAGIECRLIESRARWGGRIRTAGGIDLGPSWLHYRLVSSGIALSPAMTDATMTELGNVPTWMAAHLADWAFEPYTTSAIDREAAAAHPPVISKALSRRLSARRAELSTSTVADPVAHPGKGKSGKGQAVS